MSRVWLLAMVDISVLSCSPLVKHVRMRSLPSPVPGRVIDIHLQLRALTSTASTVNR